MVDASGSLLMEEGGRVKDIMCARFGSCMRSHDQRPLPNLLHSISHTACIGRQVEYIILIRWRV